jgi:hypothetical protein
MVARGRGSSCWAAGEAASRGSASDQADGAGPIKRTLSALFRRNSTKVDGVAVK